MYELLYITGGSPDFFHQQYDHSFKQLGPTWKSSSESKPIPHEGFDIWVWRVQTSENPPFRPLTREHYLATYGVSSRLGDP